MTDYKWTIGTGDEMMIRDTGTYVEFWFHSDAYTWNNQQNFSYTTSAGTVSSTFVLNSGGAWHKIGSVNVTVDQTVSFTIYDEGLGWPTSTRSQFIDRTSAPNPPSTPTFDQVDMDSVRIHFSDGANNGAAIDSRQISGSSVSSQVGANARTANSSYTWTGLAAKTTYYFWARTHNVKGWSAWSGRGQVTTHGVPDAPNAPSISEIKQSSVKAAFTDKGLGGVSALERQIGYGKDPNTPELFVSSNNTTISNLDPGKVYYFWSRIRNTYGWGPWSARSQVTLVAGARVNDGGVWKRAVPYVRVGGVWKVARPWVKSAGVWKETPS